MSLLTKILTPLLMKVVEESIKKITSPEQLKAFADMLLDKLEDFAKSTDTPLDDELCAAVRAAFSIPDDDSGMA